MATYYIDTTGVDDSGRNGGVGQEWATLAYAATRVTTSGDVIHVNAGTYVETARTDLSIGVSIEGVGDTSYIRYNYYLASSSYGGISLYSSSAGTEGNQSISYIKVEAYNSYAYSGINVNKRSNVEIHNCTIEGFNAMGVCFRGDASAGIDGTLPSTYETGNKIYDCIITDCHDRTYFGGSLFVHSQDGLLAYNNTYSNTGRSSGHNGNLVSGWGTYCKGLKFYNSYFYKPLLEGADDWNFNFEIGNTDGGNEIHDCIFYNGTLDIACHYNIKGSYNYSWWIHNNSFLLDRQLASTEESHNSWALNFEGTDEDVIVERNYIENYPMGINFEQTLTPRNHYNNRISYNILYNIGYTNNAFSHIIFIYSYNPTGGNEMSYFYIDNNVMIGNGATCGIFINSLDDINHIYIRNNIVQGIITYGWLVFWDGAGSISDIYVYNNNTYNNVSSNAVYYRNGKTVTNFNYSDNITSNPTFVSSTDFHLQSSSSCRDAGIDVGLGFDYEYNMVPYNSDVDIGAYEYGSYNQIGISNSFLCNFNIV